MTKTETRTLWCELTDAELLCRGEQLAKAHAAVVSEEDAQAAKKKEMKLELDHLAHELGALATIVGAKRERRDVVCQVACDVARGMVEITRTDTGEIVETRRMTDEEKQRGLFADVTITGTD